MQNIKRDYNKYDKEIFKTISFNNGAPLGFLFRKIQ